MTYHLAKPIQVVPYDPRWPLLFAQERERVLASLGDSVLALEHIGSTSVPGLPAKPIIDMMAAVRRLEDVEACAPELECLGYRDAALWLGRWIVPDRRLFCLGPYNEGAHHLHFVEHDSVPWLGNLRFRDYLRSHPDAAAEYARLKQALATTHQTDVDGYTEGKTGFVISAVSSSK